MKKPSNCNNNRNFGVSCLAAGVALAAAAAAQAGPDSIAYAFNLKTASFADGTTQGVQFVRHTLGDFASAEVIRQFPLGDRSDPQSLEWNQSLTTLYGVRSRPNVLYSVDISNGESTLIAELTGIGAGEDVTGIAIDRSNQCFLTAANDTESVLYRCDLATGAATRIGSQRTAPVLIDITADCAGNLYANDLATAATYAVDPATGAVTRVADLGVPINFAQGMTYDRDANELYAYLYVDGFKNHFARIDPQTGDVELLTDSTPGGAFNGAALTACKASSPLINSGLNGAWFKPETSGQGVLVEVLPEAQQLFLAWFTYDISSNSGTAIVGDANHRWLTAQGALTGSNTIELEVFLTSGGIFDAVQAVETESAGTMTLEFESCAKAQLNYQLDSGPTGSIDLQRVANDNVALCEALTDG